MPGPAAALALAELSARETRLIVAITAGEQQAYRLAEELSFFLGKSAAITHFPDSETLPYDPFSPHQEILSGRLAALYRLPRQSEGILIITAATLLERMPPRAWLDGRALLLCAGESIEPSAFRKRLLSAGYQSVSEVQAQGEFAVRGALIDLFPMGSTTAYRLDLFDNQVEAIRTFDPDSQRSIDKVESVRLLPGREFPTDRQGVETFRRRFREYFHGEPTRSKIYNAVTDARFPAGIEAWLPLFFDSGVTASLFEYLPENAISVELTDVAASLATEWKQIEERYARYTGNPEKPLLRPTDLYFEPSAAVDKLKHFDRIQSHATAGPGDFAASPLPIGGDSVRLWLRDHDEHRVLFVAESPGRREALVNWLRPVGILPRDYHDWSAFASARNRFGITIGPVQEGFAVDVVPLAIIAEAQVFGLTAPAATQRKRRRTRDPETILRDLNDLKIGAPVVHVDQGVGRYAGLRRLTAGGQENEYLVLEYGGGDKLYVPVASLNLIHRYSGVEGESAPLHNLGSDRWIKARNRAREKAADIAAELLQIQARRACQVGHALRCDADEYRRFCEGFPFETTPDQQVAIDAVLTDLARGHPMDRVVCGDVGFGKTEVALRAAFVAASAGRQTCILAPTTLLVQQHEKSFRDRFSGWPFKVASLSRLRTSKGQLELLDDLSHGRTDIVIGTHRLLQEDVRFKDLGLLIVDEEHRFGVRHKEKLKNFRTDVHLLTLTATPIPRTLNMSLAGLRDLSIIATPPIERLSIRTFVSDWDPALVQEACLRELKRGGQVYVLHNEIRDIERFSRELGRLVPEGRVRMAHGRMRPRELEQVMLDFYHNRFDILVCTTIIESGIDVPTANTILIDRADHFGLAQLHQLRGRVGRSNHRAFAYLFVPSQRSLTADAQRRLEAIEKLDELGAGFVLATQDLEIRGAGELLGGNQSGHIEEIGFTLYAEMLAEAVQAIRSGTIKDRPFSTSGRGCEVDLGVSALIPESYVPDVHARLVLYKRIAETKRATELSELRVEIIDRFGLLPEPVQRLLESAAVRQHGARLGIAKIRASNSGITLEFGPAAAIDTGRLIEIIQSQPNVYRLERGQRLQVNTQVLAGPIRAERILALLATLSEQSTTLPTT